VQLHRAVEAGGRPCDEALYLCRRGHRRRARQPSTDARRRRIWVDLVPGYKGRDIDDRDGWQYGAEQVLARATASLGGHSGGAAERRQAHLQLGDRPTREMGAHVVCRRDNKTCFGPRRQDDRLRWRERRPGAVVGDAHRDR
jgi:hypothetical protein